MDSKVWYTCVSESDETEIPTSVPHLCFFHVQYCCTLPLGNFHSHCLGDTLAHKEIEFLLLISQTMGKIGMLSLVRIYNMIDEKDSFV